MQNVSQNINLFSDKRVIVFYFTKYGNNLMRKIMNDIRKLLSLKYFTPLH